MPARTSGRRALRAAASWLPRHATAAHRANIAVAAVPEKLLTLTAALMTRAEPSMAAPRLADREIGRRPGWWRRAFLARQRGSNQRPMDRTFAVVARVVAHPFFGFSGSLSDFRRRFDRSGLNDDLGLLLLLKRRRFGNDCLGHCRLVDVGRVMNDAFRSSGRNLGGQRR